MNFITIIPARFFSKRLHGKPLIDICGKPMVVHVMEKAFLAGSNRVIVATDNINIFKVVIRAGGEAYLTNGKHKSGTERIGEVVCHYKFNKNQIIVNLQSDEPLIPPKIIRQVVEILVSTNVKVTTSATPITLKTEILDSNVVKVIIDVYGNALYFSRTAIPWNSENSLNKMFSINNNNYIFLRHIGIYAYKSNFIYRYINWNSSILEKTERLEQLRILWYGEKIRVAVTNLKSGISINTFKELLQVRNTFEKMEKKISNGD